MKQNDATFAYREAAVRSASQIELVVMMYDMIIEDVHHAIEAIARRDIEKRTGAIRHAMSVLEQLQGSLNMEAGGEAARNLDTFYSIERAKLLEGHMKCSAELLLSQVALFADLRAAWKQIQAKAAQSQSPSDRIAAEELERTSALPNSFTAPGTEINVAREWTA